MITQLSLSKAIDTLVHYLLQQYHTKGELNGHRVYQITLHTLRNNANASFQWQLENEMHPHIYKEDYRTRKLVHPEKIKYIYMYTSMLKT